MNIIDRYILRSHIAPFVFGVSTVVFILLMQFLMNHLDKLVGKGLSDWVIIQLIVFNMSWMLILSVPMGVLFATLLAFGSMSASHEVTIIKASGGSLFRMMRFVIVAGALVTYGLYWFNDVVLPETNHQAKILMGDIKRTKPTFALESGRFSTQLEGLTILSRSVDSLTGMMYGVTIYDESNPRKQNIISADSGSIAFTNNYESMLLRLHHGEIHQIKPSEVSGYRIVNFDDYQIVSKARGFNFEQTEKEMVSRGDREMSISNMRAIVDIADSAKTAAKNFAKAEAKSHLKYILSGEVGEKPIRKTAIDRIMSGNQILHTTPNSKNFSPQNALTRLNHLKSTMRSDLLNIEDNEKRIREYTVEIQKKYAIPFACFLFVLVGCPLGIMTKGGNFGISAGISLLFYIFYWACLIGGEKLADRGLLAPELSMWLGNIIIGVIGILLMIRVNYESLKFFTLKSKN